MDIDLKEISAKAKEHTKEMAELKRELAIERAKVAKLADQQGQIKIVKSKSNELLFGLFGDTQFGNLHANIPAFRGLMEYMYDQGVRQAYHTGDVLDGHKVYRGQEFEVADLGLAKQIARLANSTPKKCPNIDFITGNHDSSFKSLSGADVGKSICAEHSKWRFLGEEQADVKMETPAGEYRLRLVHPGGGTAYALSYRVQKMVESLGGGEKPNMLAVGHFHKAEFIPAYRNVAIVQTGTTENQTPFMARMGIQAHVGGWIVRVNVGSTYNIIKPEFVAFYV